MGSKFICIIQVDLHGGFVCFVIVYILVPSSYALSLTASLHSVCVVHLYNYV